MSSADEDRQRTVNQQTQEQLDNALKQIQELNDQAKAYQDRNKELLEQLKSRTDLDTQLTSVLDESEKMKRQHRESEENWKRLFNEKCDKVKELEMEQSLMQDQVCIKLSTNEWFYLHVL